MFKKLLGRGAGSDLDRADRWLERGDPVGALGLARRYKQNRDPGVRRRALDLAEASRRAALASILERVDAAVAAGDREEALDWLEGAFSYVSDPERRSRLEERRAELLRLDSEDPEPGPTDVELGADELYELLMGWITEDFVPLYANRGPRFREAYLALHRLETNRALELYDDLVRESPEDPMLRFERGRGWLAGGVWERAREDFEAAWDVFGDRPVYSVDDEELDETNPSLRLPYLWAEACLLGGDPEAVLERFGERAAVGELEADLIRSYISALRCTGRASEAASFASRMVRGRYGKDRWLYLTWAGSLASQGDTDAAIQVLERSLNLRLTIPEVHLAETLYALLCLYLGMTWEGSDLEDRHWEDTTPPPGAVPTPLQVDRIEELFRMLRSNLPDSLPPYFHLLEARFRELRGDEGGAAEARALAVAQKEELGAKMEKG